MAFVNQVCETCGGPADVSVTDTIEQDPVPGSPLPNGKREYFRTHKAAGSRYFCAAHGRTSQSHPRFATPAEEQAWLDARNGSWRKGSNA